jgi:hypothetical protein
MKFAHGAAVAFLVVLAGCGGFLGGGGTATPSATSPTTPTSTPTATPTVVPTVVPTPTATPLPESYTTRTYRNESLGVTFDLAGNESALGSVLIADITGIRITRGTVLNCARATPFVAISTNAPVADVTTTMSYDPSMLPENASESELSVFVYNRTVDFYVEMETTVDTENDTATATRIRPDETFVRQTENGTEQLRPNLDGTRLDNAFVVMHTPTFREAVRTRELPAQCQRPTQTPAPTATPADDGTATPAGNTTEAGSTTTATTN